MSHSRAVSAFNLGALRDTEFERIEMTEEEVRCWACRYAILRPNLFLHPLNDFAANREVLRVMAKEKFPLILAQSLRGPE